MCWRNAIIVSVLGLSALAWGVYDFLSHKITGAHVFTGFEGLAAPPIERQAPDGTPYKLHPGPAIIGCALRADDAHSQRVFSSHGAAMQYAREHHLPTVPSVSSILAACRVADARLQIALEHDLEQHADGRAALLDGWLAEILRQRAQVPVSQHTIYDQAIRLIAQAIRMGGGSPVVPNHITLPTPNSAGPADTPIGPWAADAGMAAIWRRDRFLAAALPITDETTTAVAAVLARSMATNPLQSAAWQRQARVAAAFVGQPSGITLEQLAEALVTVGHLDLTSPQTCARVRAFCAQHVRADGTALAPAYAAWASAPEETILSTVGMTAWHDPFATLIAAIRTGELRLEPSETSGFYRRWWYALEPLVVPERMPERGKLQLTTGYTERWQRTFAAGFTDGRSSIVKRMPVVTLGVEAVGPIPVEVAPAFSCEPAPAVYLRLARAYRTLARDLARACGEERWRALIDAQGEPVAAALEKRSARLLGLAIQSYREIGYPVPLDDDERTIDQASLSSEAVAWCAASAHDPDVTADARHLVTLASDGAGHYRCPAIAGVRLEPVRFSWVEKPYVSGNVDPKFVPVDYWLTSPCVLATTVERVPTPDEFRQRCDGHENVASLYAAFGASPRSETTSSAAASRIWLIALPLLLLGGSILGTWGVVQLTKRRRWMWAVTIVLMPIIALLWAYLAPPYWFVRLVAVHGITAHDNIAITWQNSFSRWAMPHLEKLFYDLLAEPDPQRRYWACWLYVEPSPAITPTAEQVEILDRSLDDGVEEVSSTAWFVLCRSRLPSADLLKRLESHPYFAQRSYTLPMIARERHQDPSVITYAIAMARGDQPTTSINAYAAISQWRQPTEELIAVMRTGVSHPDPMVRRLTLGGLGTFGQESDLAAILALLTDPEAKVRIATFQKMQTMSYEVPISVKGPRRLSITMNNPRVQAALSVYVQLPNATVPERLSAARWVYDVELQRRICQELIRLAETLPSSSQEYLSARDGYAHTWSREQASTRLVVRYLLAEAIPTWGRDSYSIQEDTCELERNPWLLEQLAHNVRQNAGVAAMLTTLHEALKQGKDIKAATFLIRRLGKPAATFIQPLAELYDRSTDEDIRWWATIALSELGPEATALAIPRLHAFVTHPDRGRSAKNLLEELQPSATGNAAP